MSTTTTRLGMTKPASSENVSITLLNTNFDLSDAAVAATVGASSAKPASAFSGRLWYETDTALLKVNSAASASTAATWISTVGTRPMVIVGLTSGDYPVSSYANANAAVQAAIDSLGSTGGQVVLKRGTYSYSAQVNLTNQYTKVTGEGFGTVVKWVNGASATGSYLFKTNSYCQVSDMLLNGNGASAVGGGGIYAYQSARLKLANLYVQDFDQDAIRLEGTSSSSSSHAAELDHIKIINCGGYGIFAGAFAYDMSIERVWVATCNVGVRLENGASMINNLHTWGHTGAGLQVRSNSNKISNSYFDSNGAQGVDIFNCNDNSIQGSDIFESGTLGASNGVSITGTSIGTIVKGNVFRDNTGGCVNVGNTAADTEIEGNRFRDTQGTKTQTYAVITSASTTGTIVANNTMRASDHLTGAHNMAAGTFSSFNNNGVDPEAAQAQGNVSGAGTVTLDRRSAATITATLTGNWGTVSVPSTYVPAGSRLRLILTQDGTGSRTVTWPANVKWAGGSLTLTTTGGKVDVLELVFDGTNWRENGRSLNG